LKQPSTTEEEVVELDEDLLIPQIARPRNAYLQSCLFVLKLLLGAAIVYWLVETGRFEIDVYRGLLSPSTAGFLVAALVVQLLALTLILGRWWFLLEAQNIKVGLFDCLKLGYQGTFVSLFLPGTIGTDGLRFLHLQRNHRKHLALGIASLTLDRALGFLGLLILAVSFGTWFLIGSEQEFSRYVLMILIASLLGVLLVLGIACGYIPLIGSKHLRKFTWLAIFIDALAAYRTKHRELLIVIILSVVAHFLAILGACFGLMAMSIEFSFLAVATVTPLLIFIRFIPLTPLGLGITDAAGEEFYNLVGIFGGAENQMLLRAVWVVLILLCGLSFFTSKKNPDE
jgi:uncharacterized protein (TIRG00374 family)